MRASPGWLDDFSDRSLRAALRTIAPELADLPVELGPAPEPGNPLWASGRATIDGRIFAKLAFSHATAARIWREAQVLAELGELGLAVPPLAAASRDPAISATELIDGAPLDYATVAGAGAERIELLAEELARFLARLHSHDTLARARVRVHSVIDVPDPALHVSTADLRTRLTTMVDPEKQATVRRWCDWIDEELARPAERVFVHGDLHPYNQVWDLDEPRLLAVLDFESSGVGAPEFDFRVFPVFGPGVGLLSAIVERYEALAGRKLSVPRIMASHLVNYLGDALWRTEAGIALPQPGDTPSAYVDEAASRLAALGIEP